jgi:hypothetical protein
MQRETHGNDEIWLKLWGYAWQVSVKDRFKANTHNITSTYHCNDRETHRRGGIAAIRANVRKTPYKIKNGSTVDIDFGRQGPSRLQGRVELTQLMGKVKIRGQLGQWSPRNPWFCSEK